MLPGGPLGLNLFLSDPKQNIPILVCISLPHHSVPWTFYQPLAWEPIRPTQTQCKRAPNFRGYKAHFPRVASERSGRGMQRSEILPSLQLLPTRWQQLSWEIPLQVHAPSLLFSLFIFLFCTCVWSTCYTSLLAVIALLSCWCIGFPRNFIIFANNDNIMSPHSILLLFPLHSLHVDQALHYCVNYQHSWLFPNLKGTSMQSFFTQGQLHGLSATSAVTEGPCLV